MPAAGSDTYTHSIVVADVSTELPVVAQVQLCGALDAACASPLAGPSPTIDGVAQFEVTQGSQGYFEVRSAGYFPQIIPFTGARERPTNGAAMLLQSEFATLAALATIDADPSLGQFFFSVSDGACPEQLLSGVSFEVSPMRDGLIQYYRRNGLPETEQAFTDASGTGGALNAPDLLYTVSVIAAGDERLLRTVNTFARAGWITLVSVDVSLQQP